MSKAKDNAAKKLDAMIADLASDFKALVAKTESSIPTTRGHYGFYMGIIGEMSKDKDGSHNVGIGKIIALALVTAGANRRGVGDAYRIVFGGDL